MAASRLLLMVALFLPGGAAEDSVPLTAAQKTALTLKHNTLRARVGADANQPCTAGDMQEVVWDDTLAAASQTYADACVGDHDPRAARGVNSDFGENLFVLLSSSDTSNIMMDGMINAWYNQYKDTVWNKSGTAPVSKDKAACIGVNNGNNIGNIGDTCNIGNYFQLIWSNVTKIGCGVKSCSSGLTVGGTKHNDGVLLVCRYDRNPGWIRWKDLRGQAPYLFGKKCAGCDGSCSTSPAGLCKKDPTRCVDKLHELEIGFGIGGKMYNNCKDLLAAYPASGDQSLCKVLHPQKVQGVWVQYVVRDSCALTCKTCNQYLVPDQCAAAIPTSAKNGSAEAAETKAPPKKIMAVVTINHMHFTKVMVNAAVKDKLIADVKTVFLAKLNVNNKGYTAADLVVTLSGYCSSVKGLHCWGSVKANVVITAKAGDEAASASIVKAQKDSIATATVAKVKLIAGVKDVLVTGKNLTDLTAVASYVAPKTTTMKPQTYDLHPSQASDGCLQATLQPVLLALAAVLLVAQIL